MDALPPTPAVMALQTPKSASSQQLMKQAQDFEATTLSELLEPMFDTVDMSNSPFGGGPAEQSWKPIMVQQIAKTVAAGGGLGIAAPVYRQLLEMQEKGQSKS